MLIYIYKILKAGNYFSELDENIRVMLSIIEEDGDSFAKRAEMYYKRRPQLIQVLDELHKSYRWLAERYDQLKSEFTQINRTRLFSPLKSLRQVQNAHNSDQKSLLEASTPGSTEETNSHDHNYLVLTDQVSCKNSKETLFEKHCDDHEMEKTSSDGFYSLEFRDGKILSGKEVSELVEEHLRQQAELISRNEKKREKINELNSQIRGLMDENEALKACLANRNKLDAKRNQLKGSLFFGKFTGCTR